jgi:hypothetical protein
MDEWIVDVEQAFGQLLAQTSVCDDRAEITD